MRRAIRLLGTLMTVAGLATLAWALVVWKWQDPFSYVANHVEQRELSSRYEQRERRLLASESPTTRGTRSLVAVKRSLRVDAMRYRQALEPGQPLGRLLVPRMGLNAIVVMGTDREALKKGPGWEPRTWLPGEGRLVYVAGHRTTYGAPFSHIDALRPGDRVTLELPYAAFEYRVTGHRIVAATYLAALRSRGREEIALQACWPRFFASQRYIAYARPVRVMPRGRKAYTPRRAAS